MTALNIDRKRRLIELLNRDAVQRGEFTLASGARSSFYIDGKQVTLSGEGLAVVAELMLELIAADDVSAVGGPTLGADPIAAAVATVGFQQGRNLAAFLIRKTLKDHGTQRRIEGPLRPGSRVVLVEDVATTGGSILECLPHLAAVNCTIVRAVVVVNRQAGAAAKLAEHGIPLSSLCSVAELDLPRS